VQLSPSDFACKELTKSVIDNKWPEIIITT
jgi:hypothetical protein